MQARRQGRWLTVASEAMESGGWGRMRSSARRRAWGVEDAEEGVAQGGGDEVEACEAGGPVSWVGRGCTVGLGLRRRR